MLAEAFHVIRALDLMQKDRVAVIGAGDHMAMAIEIQPPGVAPALGEKFELSRDRMIAPDSLLKFNAPDVGRHRAALGTIQPAIWSPLEGIGKGVGILHAEAGEQDFGISIGNIILIPVRV